MKLVPCFPKVSHLPKQCNHQEQSMEAQELMQGVSHSSHSAVLKTNYDLL